MRDDVRHALFSDDPAVMAARTIDITTIGRRSGDPRRIETVFRLLDGTVYLTGLPMERPRAWLLNLAAEPSFTFHLKSVVVADLPATATVITDPARRERILAPLVAQYNRTRDPDGPYPPGILAEWVAHSPLAQVRFTDDA